MKSTLSSIDFSSKGFSLGKMVKLYKEKALKIEKYLEKHPKEWGRFQSEFNDIVNSMFRNIMLFEKENIMKGEEERVYKLKKFFVKKIRPIFIRGEYIPWSLNKPYGYAGDFKIIDDIYRNSPFTVGFDRLFDNYFQMSAICIAVRNRKEDFKKMIKDFVINNKDKKVRIMDLASGPCRDVRELLDYEDTIRDRLIFDCYDNDERALEFGRELLHKYLDFVNFHKLNVIRLAFKKDIKTLIEKDYHIIYATGLFDYFNDKVAIAVVKNLYRLLLPGGLLAISNVRDRYSNSSVHFMEWVGEWYLVYRNEDEFINVFLEAGCSIEEIELQYEQQGIMQYVLIRKKG